MGTRRNTLWALFMAWLGKAFGNVSSHSVAEDDRPFPPSSTAPRTPANPHWSNLYYADEMLEDLDHFPDEADQLDDFEDNDLDALEEMELLDDDWDD